MKTETDNAGEMVTVACPCGAVHRFRAHHYDRVIVGCGRRFWAIRPLRNGPLEMSPWPGANLTRKEMKERGLMTEEAGL